MPQNKISIYIIDQRYISYEQDKLLVLLSADESKRYTSYVFEHSKLTFLLCRAALRILLSRLCHLPAENFVFSYNQYGKPFLKDHKIYFNVSHSADFIVLAFSRASEI